MREKKTELTRDDIVDLLYKIGASKVRNHETNDNIQFTYASIMSWLSRNGFSSTNNNFYNANGSYENGNMIVLGIAPGGQGYFKLFYEYIKDNSLKFMLGEALGNAFTITDHITQIF